MKSILFMILFLLLQFNMTSGQNANGCDGLRYASVVFSSTTQATVKYGENLNFGITEDLYMDVFQPANDVLTERPVVILAHGGYFLFGNRTYMHDLCFEYARRGFVAATIDYRKLQEGTVLDSINSVEAIIRAMQDMKAAIRYFRNDRINNNYFKVDTNFIFVGGYSAGAVTALHTAYWSENDNETTYIDNLVMAEGGLEGQSNDLLNVSSQVQCVINHSGAILNKDWIQASEPPIVSYHGTNDIVVPFSTGLAADAMVLDGSEIIHQQASMVNIPNYLYAVSGGGHSDIYELSFRNDYLTYLNSSFAFFKDILCGISTTVSKNFFKENYVRIFPNPIENYAKVQYNGNEVLEMIIFDNMGRTIKCGEIIPSTYSINLSHLNNGIYFYLIRNNSSNLSQTGKLIINH